MKFSRADADVFTPDAIDPARALARTTHLCVAAHQDDIEIMAHAGITACYGSTAKSFTGVVVTNGGGSPRRDLYGKYTDTEMQDVRREEQRRAATIGRYGLQIQLGHPSADVKTPQHADVVADMVQLFSACVPDEIYLHSPADKHDTHVAVCLRAIEALRSLPPDRRPKRVLGCEVWRDLDWLVDADKVALDASAQPELARHLLRIFESQIRGGKRYDLATVGRRAANATFHTSHETDQRTAITWAMDLTPLVADDQLSIHAFTLGFVERLRTDISTRLEKFGAGPR